MAFTAALLRKLLDIGFDTGHSMWGYGCAGTPTTNSSTEVAASGYFTRCGIGSRGPNAVGLRLGDLVVVNAATGTTFSTTGKVTWHTVLAATANVASTSASSAMLESFGFDCSLSAGTTV